MGPEWENERVGVSVKQGRGGRLIGRLIGFGNCGMRHTDRPSQMSGPNVFHLSACLDPLPGLRDETRAKRQPSAVLASRFSDQSAGSSLGRFSVMLPASAPVWVQQ